MGTTAKNADATPNRSFSFDLALSRLGLALMKAKSGRPLEDSDIRDAGELADRLARRLRVMKSKEDQVSEDVVPRDVVRSELKDTLARMRMPSEDWTLTDEESLETAVELLDRIASEGSVSPEEARELLQVIIDLNAVSGEWEDIKGLVDAMTNATD